MKKEELEKPNYIREYNGVEFIFTQEIAQIKKFVELYDYLNKTDPKFAGFRYFCDDRLDNYIGDGHMMQLLMKDGRCIGGGRITVRKHGQDFLLPLEMDLANEEDDSTYLLKKMIPELDIESGCAEVSRLVLAPEYRGDKNFSGSMFFNFFVLGFDLDPRYMFILADRVRSRMYCQLMKKFAGLDGHIFTTLSLPNLTDFEGIKMHITCWDKYNKLKEIYSPSA
jgi:hypothetical protein